VIVPQVPDPDACRGPQDVGRFEHDEENDIWYECSHDPRRDMYTWVIVPPVDP
jgi:hypothetical protein